MTKTKTLISFKLVRIVPFLLLSSCMVQLSTVPKIKNTMISSVNTAIIAVFADYKMNMSSSRDVKFYFKEINTGKLSHLITEMMNLQICILTLSQVSIEFC